MLLSRGEQFLHQLPGHTYRQRRGPN